MPVEESGFGVGLERGFAMGLPLPEEDVEEAARRAALTAGSRPSPRPVRVDEEGRIFELTGERYEMPGLSPEDVRQGKAEVEAGQTVSLKELIAKRHANGL
jgi:hypothetical protein